MAAGKRKHVLYGAVQSPNREGNQIDDRAECRIAGAGDGCTNGDRTTQFSQNYSRSELTDETNLE
jgi:hypothetical protein